MPSIRPPSGGWKTRTGEEAILDPPPSITCTDVKVEGSCYSATYLKATNILRGEEASKTGSSARNQNGCGGINTSLKQQSHIPISSLANTPE